MDLIIDLELQNLFSQLETIRKLLSSNQDELFLAEQAIQIMQGAADENIQENS